MPMQLRINIISYMPSLENDIDDGWLVTLEMPQLRFIGLPSLASRSPRRSAARAVAGLGPPRQYAAAWRYSLRIVMLFMRIFRSRELLFDVYILLLIGIY